MQRKNKNDSVKEKSNFSIGYSKVFYYLVSNAAGRSLIAVFVFAIIIIFVLVYGYNAEFSINGAGFNFKLNAGA